MHDEPADVKGNDLFEKAMSHSMPEKFVILAGAQAAEHTFF